MAPPSYIRLSTDPSTRSRSRSPEAPEHEGEEGGKPESHLLPRHYSPTSPSGVRHSPGVAGICGRIFKGRVWVTVFFATGLVFWVMGMVERGSSYGAGSVLSSGGATGEKLGEWREALYSWWRDEEDEVKEGWSSGGPHNSTTTTGLTFLDGINYETACQIPTGSDSTVDGRAPNNRSSSRDPNLNIPVSLRIHLRPQKVVSDDWERGLEMYSSDSFTGILGLRWPESRFLDGPEPKPWIDPQELEKQKFAEEEAKHEVGLPGADDLGDGDLKSDSDGGVDSVLKDIRPSDPTPFEFDGHASDVIPENFHPIPPRLQRRQASKPLTPPPQRCVEHRPPLLHPPLPLTPEILSTYPLVPPSNLVRSHPPGQLPYPGPYPIEARDVMYVKATSAERFLESAESFTSWFGGESACYVMAPGEDRENLGFWNRERARLFRESGGKEGSLAWLRHCWIDFKDKVPNWWDRWFYLPVDAHRYGSQLNHPPKWLILGDDDTFILDNRTYFRMLSHYNPEEMWQIGSPSERVSLHDPDFMFAFGGASIAISRPLMEKMNEIFDDCYEEMGNVVEWGGDLKLSRCLAKAKGVPLPDGGLTVDERIHQMEVTGDVTGVLQSGLQFLTLHHYKSMSYYTPTYHHQDRNSIVRLLAAGSKAVGGDTMFKRFAWENGRIVLVMGYSLTVYKNGLTEDMLNKVELTWEGPEDYMTHERYKWRQKLDEGVHKKNYYISKVEPINERFTVFTYSYTNPQADPDSIEIVWDNVDLDPLPPLWTPPPQDFLEPSRRPSYDSDMNRGWWSKLVDFKNSKQ